MARMGTDKKRIGESAFYPCDPCDPWLASGPMMSASELLGSRDFQMDENAFTKFMLNHYLAA